VSKKVSPGFESNRLQVNSDFITQSRFTLHPLFRKLAILMVTIAMVVPAAAQHPYLWFDSTQLAFMRAKVASNSTDWLALKAQCDLVVQYSVWYPHATDGGTSLTRGYAYHPAKAPGEITTGYYGSMFDATMDQLGACYQAIKSSDPVTANKYLTQAHHIITAMSQPSLRLVRQNDGMTRYAVSTYSDGNDLLAGASLQVVMPRNGDVAVGDIWKISGATGCTSMNGTWKVSSKSGPWTIFFSNVNGTAAPPLNANCTLDSVSIEDSFPVRYYMPALAKAYDWFYDGLASTYPGDLANLTAAMTAWVTELAYAGHLHPENNYHVGHIWGTVAGYVAFNNDNPALGIALKNALASKFTAANQFRDYHNLWMSGGGDGEGLQAYGYDSILRIIQAEYAMYLYGTDWRSPTYNFPFLDDNLQYLMEFTTPTLLALDGNEYNYAVGAAYCPEGEPCSGGQWFPTESSYISLSQTVFYAKVAERMSSPHAAQFFNWYEAVYAAEQAAAGISVPAWKGSPYSSAPSVQAEFLWYDATIPGSDWTTIPLTYCAWSGNYCVTRSAWNDSAATEVGFLGGPSVGAAGNGKTQFNSGAVTIQGENNRLLVYGLEEASRAADLISADEHNVLHDERGTYGNKKNSIFWAGASAAETCNQGLGSRKPPPGQVYTVVSFPSAIDRTEDAGAFAYFRANHLEANNAKSCIDRKYHQVSWTREVFFLRPKLVIVHDRTAVLNSTDDRAMFWTFGRDLSRVNAGVPAGITRYDASLDGVYRGAFWSVLPASAAVTVVDHDNLHYLYRAEVRPAAINHVADNWLAVFDDAANAAEVNAVSMVGAVNADAVQFNDANASLVAFANLDPHVNPGVTLAWPINGSLTHYVAGLTPGATYGISISGGILAISSSGTYLASPSGVLTYPK
jgi:hypothetical protein